MSIHLLRHSLVIGNVPLALRSFVERLLETRDGKIVLQWCLEQVKVVNTDMVPTDLASVTRAQDLRFVRKNFLHDATSVTHSTCCTLLPSPRGFTRSSPTLAAPQTAYGFGTFQIASNLILTSIDAQCTLMPFPSPATRQPRRHCTSGCQRRVPSLLRYAHDPVITASEYLCRSSCLRMFPILFPRFSVLLDMSILPKDSSCLARRHFDMYVLAVRQIPTTAANVSPS
ncbi:hypothetical protein BU25DRAFT_416094 [Macroventuria anomochaeta]|uniref:Uncharacterized protein n=1 Tax=Macroventuria anomochaeta TaxID=301207 RepID=A0ACB6RHI7_9PLEO|nr:uncharacterized protein BU25DRAFT_416094 [Macroventuria anomochaeta]KAF2621426.1 hypothetical protein BU25DRAFT_416094 [Macroventuria anomochaeta]